MRSNRGLARRDTLDEPDGPAARDRLGNGVRPGERRRRVFVVLIMLIDGVEMRSLRTAA
jgi:hypothetical protein